MQQLKIPHFYTSFSTAGALKRELCVFADASVKTIAAVAYMSHEGQTEVDFVFGKTKLDPQPGITIPRLELCTAVLAVEITELIIEEMDVNFEDVTYYTDSEVVLGYIHISRRDFMFACKTGFNVSGNHCVPANGSTCIQTQIQLTLDQDLCHQPY